MVHHASINSEFNMLVTHFPLNYPSINVGFGKGKFMYFPHFSLFFEIIIIAVNTYLVQCLIEYRLCSDLDLDGFPIFILYSSREPLQYNKARRFQPMMRWINQKINNKLYVLASNSDLTEIDFISKHQHALIGYHLSAANTQLLQNVLHHHSYNVQFATFQNEKTNKQHNDDAQTLVFYRNGEEWLSITQNNNENALSMDSINKLIQYGLLPLVEELTPNNYVEYIHSEAPIFWLWIDIDHKSMNDPIFSIISDLMSFRRVSKLEPFGCVYSDSHKFKTHMNALDIYAINSFPQALFIYDGKKYHYSHNHENDFSFDKLMKFIESIMDTDHHHKIKNNIKFGTRSLDSIHGNPITAPIDSVQDAVYAINTEYHDHIVYDPNIAVVVQYYARWSLRCKHFAADYRKIGEYFYNQTGVLITKLNIVHNDPPFYLSEIPQIVLYHKGRGNQYVIYEGVLHSTLIIEWINKQKNYIEHDTKRTNLEFD